MTRYSTTPGQADRDAVRCALLEEGIDSPAQNPTFVAAFLAGAIDSVTEVDDPIVARQVAYGRALVEMVEEDLT
jgi:hypothetical protein